MASDIKTTLLIGTLGAAVLAVAGYGIYRENQRPTPAKQPDAALASPGSGGSQSSVGRIETPRVVSANSAEREARYLGPAGRRLEWSIVGGTLNSDNFRDTVRWTAGASGAVTITCRAYDESGATTSAVAWVTILPPPSIIDFRPQAATLTQGQATRLGWKAKDFRKLILDPGGQDVSAFNGPGFEVKPAATTEYTLTATDDLGVAVVQKTTVKVIAPPEIGNLRLEPQAGAKDTYLLVGAFKGGRAELKDAAGLVLASASESPLQTTLTDLKPGTSLSFVVRNAADSTVASALQVSAQKP